MSLQAIFAQINCSDERRSLAWFAALFGRGPDAAPMSGLHEWHHGQSAGLQLLHAPADAGHGTLTMIVDDLDAERQRLADAGLDPGPVEQGDAVRIVRLRDPDGNRIVLAEPRGRP